MLSFIGFSAVSLEEWMGVMRVSADGCNYTHQGEPLSWRSGRDGLGSKAVSVTIVGNAKAPISVAIMQAGHVREDMLCSPQDLVVCLIRDPCAPQNNRNPLMELHRPLAETRQLEACLRNTYHSGDHSSFEQIDNLGNTTPWPSADLATGWMIDRQK